MDTKLPEKFEYKNTLEGLGKGINTNNPNVTSQNKKKKNPCESLFCCLKKKRDRYIYKIDNDDKDS